ncbi:baculoviral IAP repeat-containing protein 3 [Patella vulgata]|uniref:baculoviral IAP repeat-containing protein 3 n=1 Tax=Patella vulgata TaxID=6465 RepID=UPI00217F8AA4|nr:baculoviral IAP repeat-containing protein 3 [Patella vulgata]XP_055958340.1 baculoviral IAP repeat-containing protein 3 [Patella vulgata]XP_055958341.1 baculoviral IAP repeat-containing protein 3 [Patella vulgata]
MEAQKRPVQESNSSSSSQLCCSERSSSTKLAESAKLRMDTFTLWQRLSPTPQSLCTVGFYYTGNHNGDEVRCSYCLRTVSNWARTRIPVPFMEHYCVQQECPFVQKFGPVVSNLPSMMDHSLHNPYYSQFINREHSFAGKESMFLPSTSSLALAKAGFYYTGPGDMVRCFSCGIKLKKWERYDIPVGEHYKWSHDCLFLNTLLLKMTTVIEVRKEDSFNQAPTGERNASQPCSTLPTRIAIPANDPGEERVHSIANYLRQPGSSKQKSRNLITLLASPKVQRVLCRTKSKSLALQILQKYLSSYPNDTWTSEELLLAVRVAEVYTAVPDEKRLQDGQESHGLSVRENSDDQSTVFLPCGHQQDNQDCPICRNSK